MNKTKKRIETLNKKRNEAINKHLKELTEKIKDYNKPERIEKRKVIDKQLHAIGRYFNLN